MTTAHSVAKHLGKLTCCATLIMASIASLNVAADSFSSSYQSYLEAVEQDNKQHVLKFAQQAYEQGKVKFGETTIDTANLTMNLAGAELALDNKAAALQHYQNALSLYRKNVEDDSIKLIDPILYVADTIKDDKEARDLYLEAIDIAQDADDSLLLAAVYVDAWKRLKNTMEYRPSVRDYIYEANDIYQKELAENSITRVNTAYYAALAYFAENKLTKAERLFLEVIEQYQALDYSHPSELRAHALLVELYEKQNDSEKATQHCVAIGKMKPWSDVQEQVPLYRAHPNYPRSYAAKSKEGWVEMSFIIDKNGFVQSPKVITSEGGASFEKESLAALKQWRYAPKFVNGEPVEAESEVRLDFMLHRD